MIRLLMVDDDRDLAEIIKLKLETKDFSVTTTDVPQVGLRLAQENRPDIVLLDINMPGMSGIEFVQQLNAADAEKKIKIVLFSSMLAGGGKDGGALTRGQFGISETIDKATDLDELANRLKQVVESN